MFRALLLSAALSTLAGHAAAQQNYVYGGLGYAQSDYEYTFEPDGPPDGVTEFDLDGLTAFAGLGHVYVDNGQWSIAGEVDIAFGDLRSDVIEGTTTPCLVGEGGCTGEVNALATVRAVVGASQGPFRPFATAGLAIGDIEGTADFGACGTVCGYDEIRIGWAVGVGATYELSGPWRLRGEIMHVNLGEPEFSNPVAVTSDDINLTQARVGVEFRF